MINIGKLNKMQWASISAMFVLLVLIITANASVNGKRITKVEVMITQNSSEPLNFVGREDLLDRVEQEMGPLTNLTLSEINIDLLEKTVEASPFIEKAKVFSLLDGTVCIRAEQKQPIARFRNNNGYEYYLDSKGAFMPLSSNYTCKVVIVSGSISIPYGTKKAKFISEDVLEKDSARILLEPIGPLTFLDSLYTFCATIERDSSTRALIQEIIVKPNHELVLIPLIGNFEIEFGKIEDLKGRFEKLWKFYQEALPRKGWDRYKRINIKYNQQVVCEKR
jgi:cell division protein FtsQ